MSGIASKLTATPQRSERIRRGPSNVCGPIYAPDLDDAAAIEEFRTRPGESWATAQAQYDQLAGVTKAITNDKFRYHWRRRCFCWPDELRRS